MRMPALFVNHGGGPLPLMGRQPELANHMRNVVSQYLPERPKSIVVLSAHWESDPVKVTSHPSPSMYFDYGGFPPETYEYKYPAPGNPTLAQKISNLLDAQGVENKLDSKRGYDHGVFVPLMIMYPEADIPTVAVSLHGSLAVERNLEVGKALESLRDEGVLILGSGFTFHNMNAFFHPTSTTHAASRDFNSWLKETLLEENDGKALETKLLNWEKAPGARICHPREEHLLPLFMTAAAGGLLGDQCSSSKPELIYSTLSDMAMDGAGGEDGHAVTGYLFR